MSDARTMILKMLADGKITVEESERLLAAIKDENKSEAASSSQQYEQEKESQKNSYENFDPFGVGFDLRNIAKNVQQTINQTMKKTEPRSKEFKEKMKEFGNWMQDMMGTMANEFAHNRAEPKDAISVDFIVPLPEAISQLKKLSLENVFGEIRVKTGDEPKMKVTGRIGQSVMGEYQPAQWFSKYALNQENDELAVAFDKSLNIKAILDIDVTLPEDMCVSCKTLSSDIRIRGKIDVDELKTVSGNIRVMGAMLKDSKIESVSGDVQVEGGEIAMEIKSTSGDFIVRESKINELKITSVSGDILLAEASVTDDTKVKLITTSGDIMVEKITGPWKLVEALTRTGDIMLDWRGDVTPINNRGTQLKSGTEEGAKFKAESVSGDIQFI